jgi:hypothetical protein
MRALFSQLEKLGILLKQDKILPNVVTLMTGESLRYSWWSHPQAQEIFDTLENLSDHPDVLLTKLVNGKDTFIHRRLWNDFIAVAMSKDPWQIQKLPPAAAELLIAVEYQGFLLGSGSAAKELQKRLLINAKRVHTSAGKHAFMLQSWSLWLEEHPLVPTESVAQARLRFENIIEGMGGGKALLPWNNLPGNSL